MARPPHDPETPARDVMRDVLGLRSEGIAPPLPFGQTPTNGARRAGVVFVDPLTLLEIRRAAMTARELATRRPPPEPVPPTRFTPPGLSLSDVEPLGAALTHGDLLPLPHPEAPRPFELVNPAELLRLERLRERVLNPINLDRLFGPRPVISGLLAGLAPGAEGIDFRRLLLFLMGVSEEGSRE